jgi:uncharacterized membrane protein YccC
VPAAVRALRATIVVPGLFALTFKIIGNPQMTLFAAFGGFATLVMASFGGSRRDKAIAHLGLAVTGSAALVLGTVVSGITWLAALVTVPVAFAIFFGGVISPNAASGITAALLAYVLPVASAGGAATIPARLAGWWLASAVGTVAVLAVSPRSPGDRLRESAAASAAALATMLDATARGEATPAHRDAAIVAKHQLMDLFSATPYRPTGLATADQGLASVVQLLEWCTELTSDAAGGHVDLSRAAPADRELLAATAALFRDVAALLRGADASPDFARLERARAASAAGQENLSGDPQSLAAAVARAVDADAIAVAARGATADALVAARRAEPDTVAAQRRRWYGAAGGQPTARGVAVATAAGFLARHASLRSVWFRNSARGAVALAAAVAVADLSGVQHGFWVVLGTLSVLRSSAAATGSTAVRALAGTALGFAVGAALLLAIGTTATALWIALPLAVLVASYTPGTAPFAIGQAAFTVTVVVLFNLLVPAGWKVGLLRIEDVALGCAVSIAVGALFWPRGAAGVVGDDLADAFRRGADYLAQSVDWVLGLRPSPPEAAVAAITAGLRLDEALRGFLAEQGTKRVSKQDLWRLVMASTRLRLTANSLAGLRSGDSARPGRSAANAGLRRFTADLASFYDRVAAHIAAPVGRDQDPVPVTLPGTARLAATPVPARPPPGPGTVQALWVREHLDHLAAHANGITEPALRMAELRRVPWWR